MTPGRMLLLSLSALLIAASARAEVQGLTLPPGFLIEEYTAVREARSLALGDKGTLFIGTRRAAVFAYANGKFYTLAEGLNMPNGVAFQGGDLYVAEIHRVLRFKDIESRLDKPSFEVVYDGYPDNKHHGWKFIRFGPDGRLYIPVGAPCNVCLEEDKRFASITALDLETKKVEIVAEGIRNTVGFDWHPETKELWFTDNGRDMMGDDLPADELNHAPKAGMHFGFPFCHQGDAQDPQFNERQCSEFTPPVLKLGAHVASLGMRFYTGSMFPPEYKNAIFIAEHGSWNRSTPIGYRVKVAKPDGKGGLTYEPFIEGFLTKDGEIAGRPVDIQEMPDGSLLISDDHRGKIYRVTYSDSSTKGGES